MAAMRRMSRFLCLEEVSRLKGIETRSYDRPSCRHMSRLEEVSRLKGIETDWVSPRYPTIPSRSFGRSFPFEGN